MPEQLCAARALALAVEAALDLAAEPRIPRSELKAVLRLARDLAWVVDEAVHGGGENSVDYPLE